MPPQNQPQSPQQSQTLAQMIRAKFPGQYDDMADADLESKVLAKYPEYGDLPRSTSSLQTSGLVGPSGPTSIGPQPASTGMLNDAENWFKNASNDLKYGTDSTLAGKVLRAMGAKGTNYGVPESVGDFAGSPVLGPLRAAQGATEIPQSGKTWEGAKNLVGGALDAATIPLAFAGGPATEGAGNLMGRASLRAFGNVEHAGQLFDAVTSAAQDEPIKIGGDVYDALTNIKQLSDAGAKGTPRVASKLASRLDTDAELYWPEARRFFTNISRLSANEYNAMSPQMQRAVGQLGHALGSTLEATADSVGAGNEYRTAMAEYAKAKNWQQLGSDAWQFAKKSLPYAVGLGVGGRIALGALDKGGIIP